MPVFVGGMTHVLVATAVVEAGFAATYARSRALPLEQAIELAVQGDEATGSTELPAAITKHSLTRSEREVAGLVARGLTSHQITDQMVVSERTVEPATAPACSQPRGPATGGWSTVRM